MVPISFTLHIFLFGGHISKLMMRYHHSILELCSSERGWNWQEVSIGIFAQTSKNLKPPIQNCSWAMSCWLFLLFQSWIWSGKKGPPRNCVAKIFGSGVQTPNLPHSTNMLVFNKQRMSCWSNVSCCKKTLRISYSGYILKITMILVFFIAIDAKGWTTHATVGPTLLFCLVSRPKKTIN